MSLARALTSATKRMRPTQDSNSPIVPQQGSTSPNRSFSNRRNYGAYEPIDRNQISLPVELLSTTNPLAYDAPDLKDINIRDFQHLATSIPSPSPSSSTSYISDSDSAGFSSGASSASSVTTPSLSRESSPTATDGFFCEESTAPTTAAAPVSTAQPKLTIITPPPAIPEVDESAAVPEIPKRALSHTKKTHEVLARKRSTSAIRSPPSGTVSPIRTSLDMFNPSMTSTSNESTSTTTSHPFGAELAQVNELVEEITSPASTNFSPISPHPTTLAPSAMLRGKSSNPDLRSPRSPRRPMMRSAAVSERGAMVDAALPQPQQQSFYQHHQHQAVEKPSLAMDRDVRVVDDEEDRIFASRGLARWGVEAYLQEIEDLYSSRWESEEQSVGGWF